MHVVRCMMLSDAMINLIIPHGGEYFWLPYLLNAYRIKEADTKQRLFCVYSLIGGCLFHLYLRRSLFLSTWSPMPRGSQQGCTAAGQDEWFQPGQDPIGI